MKKLASVLISCLATFIAAFGQISVQPGMTPASLVQNILVGNGVTASNVSYNNSLANANVPQNNVAMFVANGTNFPLSSGILITTGHATAAAGPNNSGTFFFNTPPTPNVGFDTDLNLLAAGTVTNGAILEFDFVPSGDTVQFRYVFGSDEYPEFFASSFNDAFGFFLSGPGINGTFSSNAVNIATLPNSTIPVTINNVGPTGVNSIYYVNNVGGLAYSTAIQYDGTTVVLTAKAVVQCSQTYHIKMAICNVADQSYDSGVFIEADSFSSEAVDIDVQTVTGDTSVVEGCTDALFLFTRPANQVGDTLTVNYQIGGNAIYGVDYLPIQNPVIFLPGVDTVPILFSPIQDNINDGPEFVTLTATTITVCGDTIVSTGEIWIFEGPIISINETDPITYCINDSVLASASAFGGYPPYIYSWNFANQTGDTAYLPITQNGSINYLVTATDACGFSSVDTVTVTMNQTLAVDTMGFQNSNFCANTGVAWGMAQGVTGQPFYNWSGPNPSAAYSIDASVLQNIPSGWYTFTVSDNVCFVVDSIFVDTDPGPVADFTSSLSSGCAPLSVNFINESSNAVTYTWNFGNGNVVTVNDMNTLNQIFTDTAIITLIASDGVCADTITGLVLTENCGCTDPLATNYNPLATASDGSCVYPTPIIEGPNVITPDGDNVNDLFELDITNAANVELVITNRWGNVMFKGTNLNPTWDGKVNGNVVSDGVYFYKYIAFSVQGDEVVGHGYFHVITK